MLVGCWISFWMALRNTFQKINNNLCQRPLRLVQEMLLHVKTQQTTTFNNHNMIINIVEDGDDVNDDDDNDDGGGDELDEKQLRPQLESN